MGLRGAPMVRSILPMDTIKNLDSSVCFDHDNYVGGGLNTGF